MIATPPPAHRHISWTLAVLAIFLCVIPLPAADTATGARQSGDVNGDGTIDLTDPIALLIWLFDSGPPAVAMECGMDIPSRRNGDVDGDSRINITDCIYLLSFLLRGGPDPSPISCSPPLVQTADITNATLFIEAPLREYLPKSIGTVCPGGKGRIDAVLRV